MFAAKTNQHAVKSSIRRHSSAHFCTLLLVPSSIILPVLFWIGVVRLGHYPQFLLPTPRVVLERFVQVWTDGVLLRHLFVTLQEIGGGLALGLSVAVLLGYLLAKSPILERMVSPYLVASQAVPIVALAPLLVIWFGAGSLSKVIVCALTLFFPVLINMIVGIRNVDRDLVDLMRALHSSRWQLFYYLELPAALPVLLAGLRVGVTLSVIGAVVGEFVAADRGLGFLINLARGMFDTPLMFVALLTLMVVALLLYGMVTILERLLLRRR
jgi:NitT/TauT family transport system permease protein